MILSSVDLPAPFSPITPSDSPRRSSKLTPSSARKTRAAPRPRSRSHDEAHAAATRVDLRVVLADAVEAQQRHARAGRHTKSSKCGDSRRNTQRPAKNSASATASATASPHCGASRPSSSASRRRVDEPAERIGGDPRPQSRRAPASADRGSASGTSGSSARGISTCSTSRTNTCSAARNSAMPVDGDREHDPQRHRDEQPFEADRLAEGRERRRAPRRSRRTAARACAATDA